MAESVDSSQKLLASKPNRGPSEVRFVGYSLAGGSGWGDALRPEGEPSGHASFTGSQCQWAALSQVRSHHT